MLSPYNEQVEEQMRTVYDRLSEKDRRLYAAVEALKLPYGGISYMARVLGCSRDTIRRGIQELGMEEVLPRGQDRKAGGGRKSALESIANIDEVFLEILKEHTAGDPMDAQVKWTNLSVKEIGKRLKERGIEVSRNIVRKLLKKHDYRKRKALKKKATGQSQKSR